MKKIVITLTGMVLGWTGFAQNINYELEIKNFQQIGCDDGIGDDEEPTWKIWATDNHTVGSQPWTGGTLQGGTCQNTDDNIPIVYIPGGSLLLINGNNTDASTFSFQYDAWEDDCLGGSRCDYDSGFPCLSSDDCREQANVNGINFRDSSACVWHDYSYFQGDFGWVIRFRWEYSDFDAGPLVQETCGDSVVMSAQGSGQWSVLSGGTGGFSSNTDPTATFGGLAGNTYTLQWATFPDCITPVTQDIQVTLNALPDPNLISTTVVFCEFSTIDFLASNGVTYDWCLNSTSNIVYDDTTAGAYYLTNTSLTDSMVYVFATDANGCTGIDSISFTVDISPAVDLGNDTTICDGASLLLDANDGVPFTSYAWNTLETASAISITSPGQYYVTLTNTNNCSNSDTIDIGQYNPINFNLTDEEMICLGDSVVIDAGAGYTSYLWDDGETTQTNTFSNFGVFSVVVTDTNNCTDSDSVTISPTYFYYAISADTTISLGATIDLTANMGSGYLWNTGDTTQTISISPVSNSTYTATTLLANGCYEVGTINVIVNEELNIFVPNMFSPNGDGSNDVFLVYGFGLEDINFRIFNRWGKEVWGTTDPVELLTVGWDGKSNGEDQPTGTYVWTMTGTTITGNPVTFNDQNKGTLLLRR